MSKRVWEGEWEKGETDTDTQTDRECEFMYKFIKRLFIKGNNWHFHGFEKWWNIDIFVKKIGECLTKKIH